MQRCHAFLACTGLALAAWLGPLPWLTLYQLTSKSMVLCRKGMDHPCELEWDGSTAAVGMELVRHFLWKMLWRDPSTIVVVGPSSEPGPDLAIFSKLMPGGTTILVDANPYSCNWLRLMQAGKENIHTVNALITTDDAGGTVPLWLISPHVRDRFPKVNMYHLWYDSDLNKSIVEERHRRNFKERVARHGPDFEEVGEEEWLSMLEYLEAVGVRKMSAKEILREVSVEPKAVDALVLDAEENNREIAQSFWSTPGFSPKAIQFEYRTLQLVPGTEDFMKLIHESYGYTILGVDQHVMVAVREW